MTPTRPTPLAPTSATSPTSSAPTPSAVPVPVPVPARSGGGDGGGGSAPVARCVVTGIGVVAPSGVGVTAHWASTLAGELKVSPITAFDPTRYSTRLAGQVEGFVVDDFVETRYTVQTDRWTHLGMAASRMAMADAGYDPTEFGQYETSVVLGAGSGGNDFGQREISRLWRHGRQAVSVYQSIAWFYAATTGQTSIRHGLKGPSGVVVSEAAGGLDSLAQARRAIRRGTRAVLAGGTEAGLTPYALTCQTTSGRLSSATVPREAYKPFDVRANGYVPGEGGASLLVEDAASAAARGAVPYGELAGYAATHDAHHFDAPPPDPRWQVVAMRRAIADAGVSPDEVDAVFADGAGVPELDALEATAIRTVFGGRRVPVTAPQGFVGRLCAGGSALSVATALMAIRDDMLPAVGNLDTPDPAYGIDLVTQPRSVPVRVVLVNARGYGGFNSSLVLMKHGLTKHGRRACPSADTLGSHPRPVHAGQES